HGRGERAAARSRPQETVSEAGLFAIVGVRDAVAHPLRQPGLVEDDLTGVDRADLVGAERDVAEGLEVHDDLLVVDLAHRTDFFAVLARVDLIADLWSFHGWPHVAASYRCRLAGARRMGLEIGSRRRVARGSLVQPAASRRHRMDMTRKAHVVIVGGGFGGL